MDETDELTPNDRLDDVQRRMREHPGYREHMACEELASTVNAVLVRNLDDLLALLAQPTWDQTLAVELFQNMYRPESFALRPIVLRHGQLMVRRHNRLHNELAEANTADLEDANRLVVEGLRDPAVRRRNRRSRNPRPSPACRPGQRL